LAVRRKKNKNDKKISEPPLISKFLVLGKNWIFFQLVSYKSQLQAKEVEKLINRIVSLNFGFAAAVPRGQH
jgi:hypothetical protein